MFLPGADTRLNDIRPDLNEFQHRVWQAGETDSPATSTPGDPTPRGYTAFASPFREVYVSNKGSKTVSVINPSTNTVFAAVKVGRKPVDATLVLCFWRLRTDIGLQETEV
jgi:YVTN family beta-propeller protein